MLMQTAEQVSKALPIRGALESRSPGPKQLSSLGEEEAGGYVKMSLETALATGYLPKFPSCKSF